MAKVSFFPALFALSWWVPLPKPDAPSGTIDAVSVDDVSIARSTAQIRAVTETRSPTDIDAPLAQLQSVAPTPSIPIYNPSSGHEAIRLPDELFLSLRNDLITSETFESAETTRLYWRSWWRPRREVRAHFNIHAPTIEDESAILRLTWKVEITFHLPFVQL